MVVKLIGKTATAQGLKIKAQIGKGDYPTGIKVNDKELATVNLKPAQFHGDWNYCILRTCPKKAGPAT